MKKYILGLTIISSLFIANMGLAMEKEKKEIQTSLSEKQVSELRQAMIDYKKDKSRIKQEKIINKYRDKYPNDPFVKAKMNEKARFDNPVQSQVKKELAKPQVKKESIAVKQSMPKKSWLEEQLSRNSNQQFDEAPNMRIANKSGQRLIVGIYDRFYTKKTQWRLIEPKQTILFYIPDADKNISEWHVEVSVQELRHNGEFAKNGSGLSNIEPVSKGQIIDLEYKDDHTWFPKLWDKGDEVWYGGTESVRHLYQVRDGKKVPRS